VTELVVLQQLVYTYAGPPKGASKIPVGVLKLTALFAPAGTATDPAA